MKKKFVAVMLALFAGFVGAHRFYLRQPELGIAYIALMIWLPKIFGFPISTLIGWYDAYKLMTMDAVEFDRRYNSYFFRDRYGRRREHAKEVHPRGGQYVMLEEEEPKRMRKTPQYFKKFNKNKESESLKQSGIRKFKDYDTKGAIADFAKALEGAPDDKALHFNIACAYSLEEKAYEAFYHLDLAVAYGFREYDKILTQEALAFIRVMPEFESFKNNQFRLTSEINNRLKQISRERPAEALVLKQEIPIEVTRPNT
ncbi:MAG TPA: NINE protein [Saprospiraceae bacterium]|nr:NINE protein [Saprospiraceae bacterium]